jgi:hypothetical protein
MNTHSGMARLGWIAAVFLTVGLGCGSGGSHGSGKPDTGYGANVTLPATKNCNDVCDRLADCAANLCNEDSMSTRYTNLVEPLAAQCKAGCSDAQVQSQFKDATWSCFFESSCRAVFDQDTCKAGSHYTCS